MNEEVAAAPSGTPIVEVTWIDAYTDVSHEADLSDKSQVRDFGGLAMCKDVGYLVRRNKKEVVLAVGFVDEDSVRHSNTIPAPWVVSIVSLVEGEIIYQRKSRGKK